MLTREQPIPPAWDLQTPWNRQPCDHDRAWDQFLLYVTLDSPRSLFALAGQLQCSYHDLTHEAERCKWEYRAAAYDNWIRKQYNAEMSVLVAERGRQTFERNIRIIDDGIELAGGEVKKYLALSRETPAPVLTPNQLIRLMREFIRLQQLLTGGVTDRIDIPAIDVALQEVPHAELVALNNLQERLLKKGTG